VGSKTLLQGNLPVPNWWCWLKQVDLYTGTTPPHHICFTTLFPGPPGESVPEENFWCKRKINRGRHADHPAGRHFIRTNQYPPPPSPHIFLWARCPSCCPKNSVKALKATSAFSRDKTLEFSSAVLHAPSPYLKC